VRPGKVRKSKCYATLLEIPAIAAAADATGLALTADDNMQKVGGKKPKYLFSQTDRSRLSR
jgi:hypothetical protein